MGKYGTFLKQLPWIFVIDIVLRLQYLDVKHLTTTHAQTRIRHQIQSCEENRPDCLRSSAWSFTFSSKLESECSVKRLYHNKIRKSKSMCSAKVSHSCQWKRKQLAISWQIFAEFLCLWLMFSSTLNSMLCLPRSSINFQTIFRCMSISWWDHILLFLRSVF